MHPPGERTPLVPPIISEGRKADDAKGNTVATAESQGKGFATSLAQHEPQAPATCFPVSSLPFQMYTNLS